MKLYLVGRAIVFGDQGVQLVALKAFTDRAAAERFRLETQGKLERETRAMVGFAGDPEPIGNVMQMYARLGITEIHTVLLEREISDAPRIEIPQLVIRH